MFISMVMILTILLSSITMDSIMTSNTSVSLNYSRVIILSCSLVLIVFISYHTVLQNSTASKLVDTGDAWTRVSRVLDPGQNQGGGGGVK